MQIKKIRICTLHCCYFPAQNRW